MKYYLIFTINLFIIFPFAKSQTFNMDDKRDYNWCFGAGYSQIPWQRNILTFQSNPITSYNVSNAAPIEIDRGNTSMSDWFGNLLFYSNYFRVVNQNHQIMQNGDSLGCCTTYFQDYHLSGTGVQQSILALPLPSSTNLYYLFQTQIEWGAILKLMYSVVDMNLDNGLGAVTQKNVVLVNDTLSWAGLTACRHANGRDWWILVREVNSNRFHRVLFSPLGSIDMGIQSIGNVPAPDIVGQTIFSPDGTKLAIIGSNPPPNIVHIYLYDFNRCSGLLSNLQSYEITADETPGLMGAAFSPNSNYLYYSTPQHLYQIDLGKNFSRMEIASIDTFLDTVTQAYLSFYLMQLASDNKIYVSTGNSQYFHVIHSPDSLGLACNLIQHDLKLKSVNLVSSIPNFPNYRLGREIGSACDTIFTSVSPPLKGTSVQVYPNPTQESLTIELPQKEAAELVLLDIAGRVVLSQKLREFTETVSLAHLPKGMYFYLLKSEKGILAQGKVVKE